MKSWIVVALALASFAGNTQELDISSDNRSSLSGTSLTDTSLSETSLSDKSFNIKPASDVEFEHPKWGLAALIRNASIPYSVDFGVEDSTVTTFFPMMFYQGQRFFLRGTEGGLHLKKSENFELNAILRNHFIDIPSSFQNRIGGDTTDFGLQFRYQINQNLFTEVELMSDPKELFHSVMSVEGKFQPGNWLLQPKVSFAWREADYNNYYYNLADERIGAGVDTKIGIAARYHWFDNLYLLGGAYANYLNSNARHSASIDNDWQSEVYFGFGLFNHAKKRYSAPLSSPKYIRIAHGWATPSNLGEILAFDWEEDEYNNQLSSIFYGYPLTDELFGAPLDVYLTSGFVGHWSSDVQPALQEGVVAIKVYYTFDWPVRTRIGVAEGLSYISQLSYIEQTEMDEKGYQGSKMLNYIDLSIDTNLGDIFNLMPLQKVWLGLSIHHRSAIFESASQFGRIKGGSNYNSIYLQIDF
ncbi:MipA/OmpV family protein [Colwellia sp. MEBiC06753]